MCTPVSAYLQYRMDMIRFGIRNIPNFIIWQLFRIVTLDVIYTRKGVYYVWIFDRTAVRCAYEHSRGI